MGKIIFFISAYINRERERGELYAYVVVYVSVYVFTDVVVAVWCSKMFLMDALTLIDT